MKTHTRTYAVAAAVAAVLSCALPVAGQEAAVGGELQVQVQVQVELEEVRVTARRREEVVQDVPLPISVLDASALERSGNFNVIRLQQLTPSLQVYSSNPRNSAANIRGLGAPFGLTNDGIEQGVGQYVDDVYYSRAASSTLDFIDVERIEVLRGPQGTLYGKNTTAGAINITTRAPSFDFEARAELSAGNYGFYQTKASLSGPLVDDILAARIAVSTLNRHGTVYNIAAATHVNELDSTGVRGQLLWKASENLDVTFAADWNYQDPECCAQISARYGTTQRGANRQYWGLAYVQDTDPLTADVQRYVAPGSVPGGPGNALSGTFRPFDRITDVDAPLNAGNELGGASVRAIWDLGDGQLTSVTAFRYWNWRPQNDRDFTGLPLTTKSENPSKQDQYTQEFRYAWTGERFDYVIGLFGYRQEVNTDGIQEQGSAASRWLLHPSNAPQNVLNPAPEVLNRLTSYNNIDFENVSAALFGQLTWRITDRLRLEPGLRLNYDDKEGSYISSVINGQGEALPINPAAAFYTSTTPFLLSTGVTTTAGVVRTAQRSVLPPQTYNAQFDDWNVSGGLTSAFEFSPDVLGYATYTRGFKTGGITLNGAPTQTNGEPIISGTTVEPEEVNHYELGLKTQFFNRTLTANFAAFRTDIDDFQATVNNNLGTSTIRGYLANAEAARVQGLEVDVSWNPSRNLRLYANGALTDHEWVSFPDAPCPPELSGSSALAAPGATPQPGVAGAASPANCDISGQWLPGISKLAGSWGVEYQRAGNLFKQQGEAYIAYDGSARSKFSSNASRSIYTDVGGYALANFRIGFRAADNWEVNGWVRNAFNKDYYEQLAAGTGGNTGLIAANLGDPRVYGVTVRVDFSMAGAILTLPLAVAAPGSILEAAESPPPFSLHEFVGAPDGLKLSGSFRVRKETLDGQYRAAYDNFDDLLSLRTTLRAEWKHDQWRFGAELYDSRAYDTDPGSVLTTGEVNALEPVQAYVAYDFRDPFGKGSAATVQAGRFPMNLGSRRLVAADDYRNTTSGYTGVRADFTRADSSALTLYYTLPQERLPDDFASLRNNDIRLDRESSAAKLWGAIVMKPNLFAEVNADLGYVQVAESDAPGRPTRNRQLQTFSGRLIRDAAPAQWDFELEAMYQTGEVRASTAASARTLDVSAYFVHADLGRSFLSAWQPRVSVEYDEASGDEPGPRYTRFDTLYGMRRADFAPSGIYAALGRTNLKTVGLRVETTPSKRLDGFAAFRALWAADATDSFSTTGLRDFTGATGSYAGQQFETRIRYWVIPQSVRAEFNGVWLLKDGLTRDAPNAPGHGNTTYLSVALTMSF